MVEYTGECPKCGHDKYNVMNASMPMINRCVKCGFDWNPDRLHVVLGTTDNGKTSAGFFFYHAGNLAVHKDRPWQVCTKMGCLLAYKATAEEAEAAVIALQKDANLGLLPTNLSKWRRHDEFLK